MLLPMIIGFALIVFLAAVTALIFFSINFIFHRPKNHCDFKPTSYPFPPERNTISNYVPKAIKSLMDQYIKEGLPSISESDDETEEEEDVVECSL